MEPLELERSNCVSKWIRLTLNRMQDPVVFLPYVFRDLEQNTVNQIHPGKSIAHGDQ